MDLGFPSLLTFVLQQDDNLSIVTLDPGQPDLVVQIPEEMAPDPPKVAPPPTPPEKPRLPFKKGMHEPRYHTTTTVVETTEYIEGRPAVTVTMPKLDCDYIRTLGGILKIVCIVMCLLTFVFVISGPAYYRGANWATFVASIGIFVTTSLLLLYIFHVVDSLPNINWIVIEMVFCFVWTIFFFIAGCMLAVATAQFAGTFWWAIAAFFAFGGMCAYGFDCYIKFLAWKNNELIFNGRKEIQKASGGANEFVIRRRENV